MIQMQNKLKLIDYKLQLPVEIKNIRYSNKIWNSTESKNEIEHWHPEIEIVYTLSGSYVHYIDGKVYKANPGTIHVINSESIHKVVANRDSCKDVNQLLSVVILINKDFLQSVIPNLKDKYFITEMVSTNRDLQNIIMEFSNIAETAPINNDIENLNYYSLIYKLLYILSKERLVKRFDSSFDLHNSKLEKLREIMKVIKETYNTKLKESELAAQFNFTKEYFSRFFKKNTGMSFKEYLTRYRLIQAEHKLINTNESILQIANETGFPDAKGFINAFKGYYIKTPLQYRKDFISNQNINNLEEQND